MAQQRGSGGHLGGVMGGVRREDTMDLHRLWWAGLGTPCWRTEPPMGSVPSGQRPVLAGGQPEKGLVQRPERGVWPRLEA